ncbi:hypothetical protein [Actinoallomurus soli]|uniref:hypothetical protein n=1 Tax=Actinoallomurus soli TaxID=2952535 RepID=UPI002093EC57|nr:hypothetical protein [Actinoallomurus soli]MCO5968976.1 hypothetical protein [Actinoallomurus soli]
MNDDLASGLLSLTVTATSPDGRISATFGDQGEKMEIAFRPGGYRHYSETALAQELSRLAMRVTAGYVRAQTRLIDAAIPDVLHDDAIEYGLEDREFRRSLAGIKTAARSPDGRIAVASQALARWRVRIADGTIQGVPEEAFTADLLTAFREVLTRHQAEVRKLKDEHYG